MAAVSIKTGDIASARDVPESRWLSVVESWQRVTAMQFPDDCRNLLQIRQEIADLKIWRVLGYESEADLFKGKLHLDPEAVEYAYQALQVANPDEVIGFKPAAARGKKINAMLEAGKTQQQIAEEIGVSQQRVSQITTSSSNKGRIKRQLWMPVDPANAAAKIRDKFGEQFAVELREAL